MSVQIGSLVTSVNQEVNNGKGTVHMLLKDEEMAKRLTRTIENIEQDTKSFNEIMEAVKHSFLFRGYFRKMEKKQNRKAEPKNNY